MSNLDSFLDNHPVFTLEELDTFLLNYRTGNTNTRKALLAYYKERGRLLSIRRGLYTSIPRGMDTENYQVDPFLVASKMSTDAVLSHHTALEVLGKSYSLTSRVTYISQSKIDTFQFQGVSYQRVRVNPELMMQNSQYFGTTTINRQGISITVTGFERTLVDMLSRPDISGSWEEIWRSLEMVEFFDLDIILKYLSLLNNTTAFAKVGFYLEQHMNELMVDEPFLLKLERQRPKSPHYMERQNRKDCIMLKRWNLLVPKDLLNRSWGEVI